MTGEERRRRRRHQNLPWTLIAFAPRTKLAPHSAKPVCPWGKDKDCCCHSRSGGEGGEAEVGGGGGGANEKFFNVIKRQS